jgi:DegV family protein with EDD domain
MPNVAVVTDSVADLPPRLAEEFSITVIPYIIRFGITVYRDGLDLSADEFYQKLKTSKDLPATSIPSPGAFSEAYDKLAEKTNEILVISISSRHSNSYQVARQAVGLMNRQCRIEVLDSQWATMAEGLIVIAAARAALAGARLDEVLDIARQTINRVDICATFDTFEYLERNGRIGRAQALLGSLLKINPIIGMKNGEMHPLVRGVRSRTKAIDYLYNFPAKFSNIEGLAVEYATNLDEANNLVQRLHGTYPNVPVYITQVSPAIGAYTGPGFINVCVFGDK